MYRTSSPSQPGQRDGTGHPFGASSARVLYHAAGFLRRELGARLRLRYVPELRFFIDDSLDVSERINELLDRDRPAEEDRSRDE